MNTDSATLPSLLVVVWKDWPGRVREAVQIEAIVPIGAADQRQAMRPEPFERVLEAALQMLVERLFGAGLILERHRLVQNAPVARFP